MKIVAALVLLALGGCGSIYNLGSGPQVYGGLRQDVEWTGTRCLGDFRNVGWVDLPFSAAVDTGLLPLTALFELVRWMTGWPPPGVR